MRKKIALLVTLIILIAGFTSPVYAADNPKEGSLVVQPDASVATLTYSDIYYAYSTLSINGGGLATVASKMSCNSEVDRIVISIYLQRYDNGWRTYESWRDTIYSNYASTTHNVYTYHGYNYRVRTYFYAYSGTNVESTSHTTSSVWR